MKFITYFLLSILGVIIGIVGYMLIAPLLPEPEPQDATNQEELFGGKTKEQIAAEFLAGLEESTAEEGQPTEAGSTKTILNGNLQFDSGDFTIGEQDAGGVSYVSFTRSGEEQPALELYVRTGGDITYESIIEEAIYQRVTADKCFELAGNDEAERTCFFEFLNTVSCDGAVGEMRLECYESIPYNETGDRTYLFGQTVDFIYYIVAEDLTKADIKTVLESFDFYPEE